MLAEVVTEVVLEEERQGVLKASWTSWATYWSHWTSLQSRVWILWLGGQWIGWQEYMSTPSDKSIKDSPPK